MQDFSIVRLGKPDLVFTGDLIGKSTAAKPRCQIYRTKGGKYIGQLAIDALRSEAEPFDKPAELVNWFKSKIGLLIDVQEAIEASARQDQTFKDFWTEKVD